MLLGNYSAFNRGPIRFRTGTTTAGASFSFSYGNYNPPGWSHMIWQDGDSEARPHIGYPSGYRGRGWKLPLGLSSSATKLQAMSGISAIISFSGSANGVPARLAHGSASIVITGGASGALIVPGEGLAEITFSSTADIIGYLRGSGSAALAITADGDTLEALGWPGGIATITISANATPLGIGWMEGTTAEGGLTPTGIANAVWSAIAASFNSSGTMGNKLNSAGSAGDPWETLMASYTDPETFGAFVKKLLSTNKFLGLK